MPKTSFTDEQVELEIARLSVSDAVALARKEAYIRNRRRQRLYSLRLLEKRGLELIAQGITFDKLDELEFDDAIIE